MAKAINETIGVTISQAREIIATQLQAPVGRRCNVALHGSPGIGKTAIIGPTCAEHGFFVPAIPPLVAMEEVDLRGLPCPDEEEGVTRWLAPDFLRHAQDSKVAFFWDEAAQATEGVQCVLMQLLWGGRLGDIKLPEDHIHLLAFNGRSDRAGARRILTPLCNRLLNLKVTPCPKEWLFWAASNDICSEIRSYIRFTSGDGGAGSLMTFNPDSDEMAFASPRSWQCADWILKSNPGVYGLEAKGGTESKREHLVRVSLYGVLGKEADKFIAYLSVYRDMPDPDEALKNPDKFVCPDKPDMLFAFTGALADRMVGNVPVKIKENFIKLLAVIGNKRKDFAFSCMSDAVQKNTSLLSAPGAHAWLVEYSKYVGS